MEKTKKDYFLFNTRDYLRKSIDWTNEEKGLYFTLVCIFHLEGQVPKPMIKLLCNGKEFPKVLSSFTLDKDGNITGE